MNIHYVYVHRTATDGRVFYVGQGAKRRAWSHSGRNRHWHRTVKKYGYEIEIIVSGLPKACALSIERSLIKKYGRENLCNLTDGGDIGPTGLVHSEDFLQRQSERMRGNSYTKGRKLSVEHKDAISRSGTGRIVSETTKAKLRARVVSPETRAKLSKANKGRKMSEEWRRKNSEAQKRRPPPSPETRAKISESSKGKRTGKDNPAYGIPKTPEQKARLREAMLGRKFRPESLAKRSGKGHPRYDPTPYTLVHPDHGEVTEERLFFRDFYGISSTKFSALLAGRVKSCKGWRLPVDSAVVTI